MSKYGLKWLKRRRYRLRTQPRRQYLGILKHYMPLFIRDITWRKILRKLLG